MKDNYDILDVLEQHWEHVDEIAERSQVRVVRWNMPESPRRWLRSIAASVVAVAIGAALLMTQVPQPDGLYASNLSHRSKAIDAINEISMSIL